MQSFKTFQRQSTWTCDRYWTFSDLASQSNHLATDHQRHWRQCDDVGNYDEQGDAKGVVMHRPLVASVYNYLQTCDDAFSYFWKDETRSERLSCVVNTRYCKYFEDSSCTDTQLTNQNCESCLRQILQQTSSFVLNWICLGMWVKVKHRWTFCTFGLVGTKVDGELTGRN